MLRDFLKSKFIWTLCILSVLACTESSFNVPSEFVHLYGDLRIAAREYGEVSPDGRVVRKQILEKYGYTAERFDSMATKIQKTSSVWESFQDSVVAYLDSVAIAAGAIAAPKTEPNLLGKKK